MEKEDALIATIDAVRTRVSTGDAIISLAIPIEHASKLSSLMSKVGHSVGVAFAEVEDQPKVPRHGKYGQEAKALKLSSFFRIKDVWKQIGNDACFLDWLRNQPCAFCGDYDYVYESGEKRCEAAHIRRVGHGSGTAIKPEYSAIPLCHKHHEKQHKQGESSLGNEDWWAKQRIKYVEDWAWDQLKKILGYDSWKEVPPNVLYGWADDRNIAKYLPEEYRG